MELPCASTSPLPSLPPQRCSVLSCLFDCYVNAHALLSARRSHKVMLKLPEPRDSHSSSQDGAWLNEMCVERSPPTPQALKWTSITVGVLPLLSFTPEVLLERDKSCSSLCFAALQLLVLAACYDGCCPQRRISHGERTLFCQSLHLFIQAPPCGVSQDEGTGLDQRSTSSEGGKLKPSGP